MLIVDSKQIFAITTKWHQRHSTISTLIKIWATSSSLFTYSSVRFSTCMPFTLSSLIYNRIVIGWFNFTIVVMKSSHLGHQRTSTNLNKRHTVLPEGPSELDLASHLFVHYISTKGKHHKMWISRFVKRKKRIKEREKKKNNLKSYWPQGRSTCIDSSSSFLLNHLASEWGINTINYSEPNIIDPYNETIFLFLLSL